MKKVISLLLALVLCLSLCACGGSTNNTTTPPTADSEASDSKLPIPKPLILKAPTLKPPIPKLLNLMKLHSLWKTTKNI